MILLGSALGKAFTSVTSYYQSYGVVLAVVIAGAALVAVAFGAARLIDAARLRSSGRRCACHPAILLVTHVASSRRFVTDSRSSPRHTKRE